MGMGSELFESAILTYVRFFGLCSLKPIFTPACHADDRPTPSTRVGAPCPKGVILINLGAASVAPVFVERQCAIPELTLRKRSLSGRVAGFENRSGRFRPVPA